MKGEWRPEHFSYGHYDNRFWLGDLADHSGRASGPAAAQLRLAEDQVRRDKFSPDIVISLSDRAAVLAYMMERELAQRVPVITAIWDHSPATAFHLDGFERLGPGFEELLPSALREKRDAAVLLIDDYTRSGRTMAAAVELLKTWGFEPDNIRTAAAVTSKIATATGAAPNYFDSEVEHVRFLMPWGRVR